MSNPSLKWFWAYWAFLMVFTATSRPLATWLRSQGFLLWVLLSFVCCGFLVGFYWYRKEPKTKLKWRLRYIVLGLVFTIAVAYFIFYNHNAPLEEYVHILMFGLPAVILEQQTKGSNKRRLALFLILALAVGDEIWQYYLPDRFFDVRDIIANVGFALGGWWFGMGIEIQTESSS